MNIAFLFNSDHKSLGSYYGPPIMEKILKTSVLQNSFRHMRISVGDVLTFSVAADSSNPTYDHLEIICKQVYIPKVFNHLKIDLLESTYKTATVYCWLFQNITETIAMKLDIALKRDETYLGSMDVRYNYGPHLALFRNSLCENYGIYGEQCHIFYNLGDNEDPDSLVKELFEQYGFSVEYEDIGARRTIFDDYVTLEHFQRVEDFKNVFSKIDKLNEEIASDIVFFLEELHPKLFDSFASAARALDRAETVEDYAQVAISGRRLLEKIADYLFPPRREKWNNRDVGKDKYRNRIWAYIEETIKENNIEDGKKLEKLGKEADRLIILFNTGLHADITKKKIETALADLVLWLCKLIELSPESIKRPYLAYENRIEEFIDIAQNDLK